MWCTKLKDVPFRSLSNSQIVNHFPHNSVLTSKSGLCKHIKELRWYGNMSADEFFPRCFNLAIDDDFEAFVQEF
jgi:tubulin monoglycylase TTLL3/8